MGHVPLQAPLGPKKPIIKSHFRADDIMQSIILIRTSKNAHSWINYAIDEEKLSDICKVAPAKEELLNTLRLLTQKVEETEEFQKVDLGEHNED